MHVAAKQLSINGTGKKKEDAAQQKKPLSAGAAAVGAMTTSRDDLEVDETAQLLLKARLGKSVGGSSGSTIVKADFNKDELFFHGQQGAGSDSSNNLSTLLVTAAGVGNDENVAITLSKVINPLSRYPSLTNLICYVSYLSVAGRSHHLRSSQAGEHQVDK